MQELKTARLNKPKMALFKCLEKGCGHRWRRPATEAPIDCPACPRITRGFEASEAEAVKLSRRRVRWLNYRQFEVDPGETVDVESVPVQFNVEPPAEEW